MQNIHPQATIYSSKNPIAIDAVRSVIAQEFPEIRTISPQSIAHVIVQPNETDDDDWSPNVAMLKGINPNEEVKVSTLANRLISSPAFTDAIQDNHVIIGKELALTLSLSVGDTVNLIYFEQPIHKQKKVSVQNKQAVVGGIFDTGIEEFDTGLVLCSLDFFETIFEDQGITQIGLSFHPDTHIAKTVVRLRQRLALDVYTWQDLYPALVSALMLEKYAMFFILLLITLVASMNIIALIFMLITQKQSDIAILRAMGMSCQKITALFIAIGMIIASVSSCLGIVAAWAASWFLEQYPFIQLPDTYYVSHLPANMNWSIAAIVFIVVMTITFFASWLSSRRVKSIIIAHVLRFEG